ncbi:ATP-binding protein [Dyella sp. OK004]|uniref:ATP-binding protein n=1 Tax=Dyella sp. OK004 TaxID=1855292 RepID=UPI0015A6EF05|nr:ATP-binding protein [Dyella sp. OK004]
MLPAVMSHEVRTAVDALSSSIELLAHAGLGGEQHELLTTARTRSRNLPCLLSNALDYIRTEATAFTSALVACDVLAVARHCVNAQQLAIESKGLQVKLDLPCGPLPYLMLDETRLRQVLDNLFGNAVKFTTEGHVGMALWQEPACDGKDGLRLVVEVYDTGFGIPADQQHALFKQFSQAHGPLATQLGGSGLGLSICREIVAQLGGKLSLTSEAGVGTSVRIELPTGLVPIGEDEDVADSAPMIAAMITPGQHGKVLLVEDHPANRKIIQAQLRRLGYDTTAVDHGQAAIDAFRADDYVAVLLDGELPDMNGYQVAEALRELEASHGYARVPLVAISATQGDAHRKRCEMSGIDAVLGKPLSIEKLRTVLAISADPIEIEEDTRALFVQEARNDLVAIRTAITAGELALAAHHAHRIKGSTLIFGDRQVQTMAGEIEQILIAGQHIDSERVEAMLSALEHAL